MISKLRYHETGTLSSTAGSLASYLFRWNSTFDPDFTGGGHQPLYRDTYAAIFDHYSVISATAVIKFVNPVSNSYLVGCVTDDDSTLSSQTDTLCEQNTGVHTLLPPLSGSLSSHTFTMTWDCKRVLGIDPYDTQGYKTAVGSNPSEESYLILWATDVAAGSTSVLFDIELYQTIMWSELSTPVQS